MGTAIPSEPMWKMPVVMTRLVGRDQAIAQIIALLKRPEVRLLTLLGWGGVGKTRLGIQVTTQMREQFSDGACFITLATTSMADRVIPTIAQALNLQEQETHSPFEQIKSALQEKQVLLLLDNFEHVVQAAAEVEALLALCPLLKILITSRTTLRLETEYQFPVAPLALPDLKQLPEPDRLAEYSAIQLFLQRVQTITPTFQLTEENARVVAEICTRLDGLPLAIELAAARIKLLPPHTLLARLDQRLAVLTSGARTLPRRQQTLRNMLDWSYHLLEPHEQQIYQLLSVFVDGCTLEAIEWMDQNADIRKPDGLTLLDTLASLLDKSFLQQAERESEEPRLVMLDTLREYGLTCLQEVGAYESAFHMHARYCLVLAERGEHHLRGGGQQHSWLKRLNQEQENFRAALGWLVERQETELALRLSGALWWYWTMRGYRNEALHWLETTLELPTSEAPTKARAKALLAAGFLRVYRRPDPATGIAWLEESIALSRRLGDTYRLAEALALLSQVQMYQKNEQTAQTLIEESLQLCQEIGDTWLHALAQGIHAIIVEKQGDESRALILWQECLRTLHELGDMLTLSRPLNHLASLARARGDYAQATAFVQENLTVAQEVGNLAAMSWSFGNLGDIARVQGDSTQAIEYYNQGLTIAREIGDHYAINRLLSKQRDAIQDASSPHSPRPTQSTDELTAREIEVLRLVAQGLTDAQVAEQLTISPRTVGFHLQSIYRKIQVSSRSAATRYALEHHLL